MFILYHTFVPLAFAAVTDDSVDFPIIASEVHDDNDEHLNYLIMFDLPLGRRNLLEDYVRTDKENLALAHGATLIREDEEPKKAKPKKNRKKNQSGKFRVFMLSFEKLQPHADPVQVQYSRQRPRVRLRSPMTPTRKPAEYGTNFAKLAAESRKQNDAMFAEQAKKFAEQESTIADLRNTIAEQVKNFDAKFAEQEKYSAKFVEQESTNADLH